MNTEKIAVDGFRFVENLHTTARQLRIFSEIVRILNYKQLHKRILEQLLIEWSVNEEEKNEQYNLSKGKITSHGKPTIALRYHLELSPALGLTARYNDLYMNTKISRVFIALLNNLPEESVPLLEALFYNYQLLTHDADGIILCLSELYKLDGKNQSSLQHAFKEALNKRLINKRESAPENVKSKISEKYRSINFIWKKPEKYAEHIIAPRYEWLAYVGLVKIERTSRTTSYSLSERGNIFYEMLPYFSQDQTVKDINEYWIQSKMFDFFSLIYPVKHYQRFGALPANVQQNELGNSLLKATTAVQSSMSFKLPILETFLFVCLDMYVNRNIVLNFTDIKTKLDHNFVHSNKAFLLKEAGRINEGYITISNK